MQLQKLIKHQIFTFIARNRRVICGWNVYFGNKASSWCTDRGGPLILDDVILLFVLRIFNWNYFNPTLILISSFTSFGIEGIVSKQTLKCSFLKHLFLKIKINVQICIKLKVLSIHPYRYPNHLFKTKGNFLLRSNWRSELRKQTYDPKQLKIQNMDSE